MDGIFLIIESFVRQTIYSLLLEKRERKRKRKMDGIFIFQLSTRSSETKFVELKISNLRSSKHRKEKRNHRKKRRFKTGPV